MPFCPSCEAEYRENVRVCPACATTLVEQLEATGSPEDSVDVYECYDVQLAPRAVELLREGGLEPFVRDTASTAFPVRVGTSSEQRIAVVAHNVARAREILSGAVADGVLATEDGELL